MRGWTDAIPGLACALMLWACSPGPELPAAEDRGPPVREAWVISNGWHTAVVMRRGAAADTGLLPEAADFPDASFLEFGWGDREYYQAEKATVGLTLSAALLPTSAVMHVAGFARPPEQVHARFGIVRVALGEAAFRHLVGAIGAYFERPEEGLAQPLAPGLYADSHFYAAQGTFHIFNTCNTWTARVLRTGGIDLSPAGVITAGQLMRRLRAAVDQAGASAGAPSLATG